MKLQELFNTNIPVMWNKEEDDTIISWDGHFNIGENRYMVYIDYRKNDSDMRISFGILELRGHTVMDIYAATDAGYEYQIFSVVINSVKQFVSKYKPETIRFSAKGDSRLRLYDKMVKVFGSKFGYRLLKKGPFGDGLVYILKRT